MAVLNRLRRFDRGELREMAADIFLRGEPPNLREGMMQARLAAAWFINRASEDELRDFLLAIEMGPEERP